MISISTLPNKISTELIYDDFIFTSRKRNNIPVPELSIIINKDDVDQYICTLPRTIDLRSNKIPFYLQHTDLFRNAQLIFTNLFGVEPDILIIYAYKNDSTKSAFLFSNIDFIQNVNISPIQFKYKPHAKSTLNNIVSKINNEKKNERTHNNISYENSELHFTLPKGIFPVIGAYNDLTADDKNPNFNLIFGSYFSEQFYNLNKELESDLLVKISNHLLHREEDKWEGDIDSRLKNLYRAGIPLYCVKNFNLKSTNFYQYFDPSNMTNYFQYVNPLCADDFAITISNMLLSYNRGTYLPASANEFAACMPHFYKVDRTPQSVRNTESLQNKLRNLYDTADAFGTGKSNLNFKDFIEFFILESIIDFELFFQNPGQELYKALTHKRTMNQLVGDGEILSNFLKNAIPNNDFELFKNDQVLAKTNVQQYL